MNLNQIKKQSPEAVLASLKTESQAQSIDAGRKLIQLARDAGLNMADYLTLAIDPKMSETPRKYEGMNGFEAALCYLNLPIKNDFENGVLLQAAADTFATYAGVRAVFPETIDQMLRWTNRQDKWERVENLVSQSRTIQGSEVLSTVVDDDSAERDSFSVPELGRIPVRTIKLSQQTVGIYKHGSAMRFSYEFQRRVALNYVTPYAARIARELEISKVRAATSILLNGDGVNGAAPVLGITSFGGTANTLSTQYKALAKWLIAKAQAGTPIDTIAGNLNAYLELLFMFSPTLNRTDASQIEAMAQKSGIMVNLPIFGGAVDFALSSSVPANKLIGFTKAETLEELVESGSDVSESEKSILNQSVTYTKTQNSGYRLIFGDSRHVLDYSA